MNLSQPYHTITYPCRSVVMSKVWYKLSDQGFRDAIADSQLTGFLSEELCFLIKEMANRFVEQDQWKGYSIKEDIEQYIILLSMKYVLNFNLRTSDSPFQYLAKVMHNAALQYLQHERKQRDIVEAYKSVNI